MKIVFMGTPPFAIPSLKKIEKSRHKIVSVVTVPDKPGGRGLKLRYSAVKEYALKSGIRILQPEDVKSPGFIESLKALNADLFVVVAFQILPAEIFEIPPLGTINLHSSLLPKYRGAAPINWAIINGETETGVSTFFINKKVDAGNLLLQRKTPIAIDETAGQLHDRLAIIGADLLLETIDAIAGGRVSPAIQTGEISKAPKLTNDLCNIVWSKTNEEIRNLIRGLSPVPGAFSYLNGKLIKIFTASNFEKTFADVAPGEIVLTDVKRGLIIANTGGGALQIDELQPEGKRKMSAREFLMGYKIAIGDKFTAT